MNDKQPILSTCLFSKNKFLSIKNYISLINDGAIIMKSQILFKKILIIQKINCTYELKEDLYIVLASSKVIDDQQIFFGMIEMFRNETILDCLRFLFQDEIPKYYKEQISQTQNLSFVNIKY
ncbi:unnamed protein product [Paramecium primaurelia]|uniref:Uncharacterized protein n=1 Tax=Paramecium primaurelia TaxID=5886 RepID=A0A8S1MRM1_PARPR|nr:unnamed protein product [Paramecium primaurelia]